LGRLRTQAKDLGIAKDAPGMYEREGAATGLSPQITVNRDITTLLETIAANTAKGPLVVSPKEVAGRTD